MNTTQLLAEIRRLWLGPATTLLQTDTTNLLAHADRVTEEILYPELLDIYEEYQVAETRVSLTSSQRKYAVPERAYNSKPRKVEWRSGSDGGAQDFRLINRNQKNNFGESGQPGAYYFEGDFICFQGSPSGSLDIAFYMKPSSLTPSDSWREILTVDSTTQVTLTSAPPASWATSTLVDIQDAHRSGMLRYWDLEIATVVGSVITFSTEIGGTTFGRTTPTAGDLIAAAGSCGRPMVPEGLHGTLARGVCSRVAEALGDGEILDACDAKFEKSLSRQLSAMTPRMEVPRPLINYNSRFRRWGGVGFGRGRRRFW
jgi:hypothetical protein